MLSSIPVWVPAVFLGLLFLGYRLSITRAVRPAVVVAIAAAMFCFSLYGVVTAFGVQALPVLAWLAAYIAVAWVGVVRRARLPMARVGSRVLVPGSWVPMVLMLGIFAAKFILGFAAGLRAPVLHNPSFIGAMSAALGLLSGGFGARAVAILRFARPT